MILKTFSLTLLTTATLLSAKTKVACIGDSITFGARVENRKDNNYPTQLGNMLGEEYEVRNFGISGTTMLQNGDKPYMNTPAYKASLAYNPDIIIIKLGTNDSKKHNWQHKANFTTSANNLIASYQKLTPNNAKTPRIILCKPVLVVGEGNFGITEKIVRKEVSPLIEAVALKQNLELVDLHIPLRDQPEWIPDKVHPNAKGAKRIATHLHRHLTIPRDPDFKLKVTWKAPLKNFHGFKMIESENGRYKTVIPHIPAKGSPWIWRARFWNHEPQFDIQMLELGYHVVYCDVADLFGSPLAVKRWDIFYKVTQQFGLHPKPILEGMSRGGLIIHNWALANPNKVSGIIGDNCVLDIKSWPAGFATGTGHAKSWQTCKKAYGFKTDQEAKTYPHNPIDHLTKLTTAKIPLLYLIGTADKIVPPEENSALAAKQLKPYPHIQVILKPGKAHHPHSLPNPAHITDFALSCYGIDTNPAHKD
ncbi:MAG: GDSL-type esterase/lipase family protein [Akkermansiaceae bacterium]